MLEVSSKDKSVNCSAFHTKHKSIKFITSLFRRNKPQENMQTHNQPVVEVVGRVGSSVSVRDVMISPALSTPALSTSALSNPALSTPARNRDIDSDMEALRISRHDNPFLKQVLASRESLADSLEESESDDTNLMSQDLELDLDPLSLPEVHEHMIRSPPPTSWPRSPNFKMFNFPNGSENNSSQESLGHKSPLYRSVSSRQDGKSEPNLQGDEYNSKSALSLLSPRLTLPARPHQRSSSDVRDRNLVMPAPLRSLTDVRRLNSRSQEDSQYLVSDYVTN